MLVVQEKLVLITVHRAVWVIMSDHLSTTDPGIDLHVKQFSNSISS